MRPGPLVCVGYIRALVDAAPGSSRPPSHRALLERLVDRSPVTGYHSDGMYRGTQRRVACRQASDGGWAPLFRQFPMDLEGTHSVRFSLIFLSFLLLFSAPLSLFAEEAEEAKKDASASHEQFAGMTITDIRISGNEKTKDRYVWREIELEIGEPLDLKILEGDIRRLNNVGVFSTVEVVSEAHEGGVALEYKVREMPGLIPYVTFAYSETDGWSVGPAVSAANAFGRTIKLSGYVLFGGTSVYGFGFRHPWIAGKRVFLDASLKHMIRDNVYYDFQETDDEVTPWIGGHLGENGRIEGMIGYFSVGRDKDGRTLSDDNRDEMVRLGLNTYYDSRDIYRDPHIGWHSGIEFMASGGISDTPAEFLTGTLDIRRYQPVLWGNPLAVGVLTTLQTGTVGVDIPEYMQFNLGGANTIRGYSAEGLGMKLFGKNQLILTVEQRFDIIDLTEVKLFNWSLSMGLQGALFLDSGIAWSTPEEFTWQREKTGVGLGLRILCPWVDRIRLDVGFNQEWESTFHLGFASKFDAQRSRTR